MGPPSDPPHPQANEAGVWVPFATTVLITFASRASIVHSVV